MGVNITELLPIKKISLRDLKGKTVAIDASLFLYQFLSSIRQADGAPLSDSNGEVTSHLSGLFQRSASLMGQGIRLIYVFDGSAPALKEKERERRREIKLAAEAKYHAAAQEGDIREMKKFASRTSRLTTGMVDEAKELLMAMGIPVIQAPSEAEAQAAHMVKKGDAYALASQDADTLMFGTPLLVRNLSIAGKRKKTNAVAYQTITPELVSLTDVFNNLSIDQDRLIALCMLVGTDFNRGGIKGIGPKTALKLVKEHDLDSLFSTVKWSEHFEMDWTEVFYLIKKMPVTDDYHITFNPADEKKVKAILCARHGFSEERIEAALGKIIKDQGPQGQKGLGDFF